jgi:hypothetical protein
MVKNPLPSEVHTGGCQCGAVRFRFEGAFGNSGICHCRMCQKAFGSFGAALVSAAADNLKWTRGTPSTFRSSSIVRRGFCADCGTPLFMREDGDPNYELAIGALDNPNSIPAMTEQSGIESKVGWFGTMHDLPSRCTDDYRTPADLQKLRSLQHPDHDTEHWS